MNDKSAQMAATRDEIEAASEGLRPLMFAIAYRMLVSAGDAEDVVQEAYLRFHRTRAQGTAIESPKAFLTTVTTRLAIDALRSARMRRETYVGVWLPEPIMASTTAPDPAEQAETRETLSLAFLVLLETLSPVERAVFLLREVFDYDYAQIAEIVQKSEDNCRQLFTRARKRVEEGRPRFDADAKRQQELAARFFGAADQGDLAGLVSFLSEDVALYGDGGGKAHAYPRPLYGRERVALALRSLFKTARQFGVSYRFAFVNGQPGALAFDPEGSVVNMLALDITGGAIQAVRSIVNPDKLTHLGFPVSEMARIKRDDP
ncbi:MAG TPA: RNA polymerase sigma-70 factor [Ktedonobacterales bacterium]